MGFNLANSERRRAKRGALVYGPGQKLIDRPSVSTPTTPTTTLHLHPTFFQRQTGAGKKKNKNARMHKKRKIEGGKRRENFRPSSSHLPFFSGWWFILLSQFGIKKKKVPYIRQSTVVIQLIVGTYCAVWLLRGCEKRTSHLR
jgi:hypothetical protein